MPNVLLTSAGRRVSLAGYFRDIVIADGFTVNTADMSPFHAAARVAERSFTVPPINDPDYLDQILRICQGNDIRLVIPLLDPELPLWAEARDRFQSEGITVAASGPQCVALAHDKLAFAEHLATNGFSTPRTLPWLEAVESWTEPAIVKPRTGSSSIGLFHVSDPSKLRSLGDFVDEPKELIVQELAQGIEVSIDLFVDENSELRGCIVRESVELRAGEVSKARVVDLPAVVAEVKRLMSTIPDAFGPIHMDAFYDPESETIQFLEMNARFSGGFPLSHAAGAPYVQWLCQLADGQNPNYELPPIEFGKTLLRFDSEVFVESKTSFGESL